MLRPGGYARIEMRGGRLLDLDHRGVQEVRCEVVEADTFSCAHCNALTHVLPKMDPADLGGLCKQCAKLICCRCLDKGCTPLEKKLELAEKREIALRSYGF